MNHEQTRDPLVDDLSRLPRLKASDGFTDQVLTALAERERQGPDALRRLAWAGAAAVVLTLLVGTGVLYQRQKAADLAYQRQVQELRSRYEELLEEVGSIRQEASAPETRLYLGGDDALDLMLDLNQLDVHSLNARQDSGEVRPASWER